MSENHLDDMICGIVARADGSEISIRSINWITSGGKGMGDLYE